MLQVRPWNNVILHLDADAYFASVTQAIHPHLRGKPVVTGAERGVATSISYEAKKLGVIRAMPIYEVKRKYPQCIIVHSDYEVYELFSKKIFDILYFFSPTVERYSIDEAFLDLKGLRSPFRMSYRKIGETIQKKIQTSLGITISIGISLTKTLAKVASSYRRPSGLTVINGLYIEKFLKETPIEKVWGIGENTASYLKKLRIQTAYDFVHRPEHFIKDNLSKPYYEIWRELRGEKVFEINNSAKTTYQSITRSHTVTPPTGSREVLFARVLSHIEEAFEKARRYDYLVGKVLVFLKTQTFLFHKTEIKLNPKTAYPLLIRSILKSAFAKIYKPGVLYRTCGCVISDFEESGVVQEALFLETTLTEEKIKKIYPLYEKGVVDFGSSLFEREQILTKKPSLFRIPWVSTSKEDN